MPYWILTKKLVKSEMPTNSVLPYIKNTSYGMYQTKRRNIPNVTVIERGHTVAQVVEALTTLQVGRSWVRFPIRSLDVSVDLILPAILRPWGQLSLQQK
jgi:hypothetical protein